MYNKAASDIKELFTKVKESSLTLLLALLSSGLLFVNSPLSAFQESLANMVDGRLLVGIVEHWFLFFSGDVPWRDMSFFYPVDGTLGLSDALFIYSLPYSVFRALGIGPYLSWDLTMAAISITGYCSMYLLLKKLCRTTQLISHVVAALFILGAPMCTILKNSHEQLYAVWLLPVLVLFLSKALCLDGQIRIKSMWWWLLSCAYYGAVAYTSFYISWFFGLVGCSLFAFWIMLNLPSWLANYRNGRPSFFQVLLSCRCMRAGVQWMAAVVLFLICLTPFLLTYVPVVHGMDIQDHSYFKETQPNLLSYITPGVNNVLYGDFLKNVGFMEQPFYWELGYGIPVGILTVCLIGAGLYLSGFRKNKIDQEKPKLITALALSVCFISILIYGGDTFTPWEYVRKIIPGATAIRAVFRINILVYSGLLIVAAVSWDRIYKSYIHNVWSRLVLFIFLGALFFEQTGQFNLDARINRNLENNVLKGIPQPEEEIEAFFLGTTHPDIAGPSDVLALRVAQSLGIPTIQGSSGIFPSGSDMHLYNVGSKEYFDSVERWVFEKRLQGTIGELDLKEGNWTLHPASSLYPPVRVCELNKNVLEQDNVDQELILPTGWYPLESWGVWANAKRSVLTLPIPEIPTNGLKLRLKLCAFLPKDNHKVSVAISVAGEEFMSTSITYQNPEIEIIFPVDPNQMSTGFLDITFYSKGSTTPKENGIADDLRQLGFGLSSCILSAIE